MTRLRPKALARHEIHPEHLNTPRLVADATGTTVWKWDQQEPFGADTPNGDPGNTGTTFDLPLRLPGQYFDREDNLAYNYFRGYDANIGRYLQSDPIGLEGGLNTYAYVDGKPLSRADPFGLMGFGGGGTATNPPKQQACGTPCPDPITLDVTSTACRSGDELCAQAMQAAGVQGPYFPSSTTYSRTCLITFGIGFKGSLFAAGTAAQKYGPQAVTIVAGETAGAIASRAAAIAGSPAGIAVSASWSIAAILSHCRCMTTTQ